MPKLAWHRAIQRFTKTVTLTQYSSPAAVSGYAPSKGADTTSTQIRAALFPVITEELAYLFQGILDKGEAALLISTKDVSNDINTGDRITDWDGTTKYKVTKLTSWDSLAQIKVYSLELETI